MVKFLNCNILLINVKETAKTKYIFITISNKRLWVIKYFNIQLYSIPTEQTLPVVASASIHNMNHILCL